MNANDDLNKPFEEAKAALQQLPGVEAQARARAAFLAAAAVTPEADARHSLQHGAPFAAPADHEGEEEMAARITRRLRLIAAVLSGVLLAAGLWTIPPLRSMAQEIIDFFVPGPDNTRRETIHFGVEPPEEIERARGLLDDAIAAAPFDVHVPTDLPNEYRLESAEFTHGGVLLMLTCAEPWTIFISQRPYDGSAQPFGQVGASAVVETVDINGAVGQYVHGTWETVLPENFETLRQTPQPQTLEVESVWNNHLPWGRLAWTANGILFEINSAGGILSDDTRPHRCAPSRDLFVRIARGLVASTAPAP